MGTWVVVVRRARVLAAGFQVRPGRGGRNPPRASMASAMSASGDLKPNAMRCSSLILVLVDSMSALERTVECATSRGFGAAAGQGDASVSSVGWAGVRVRQAP